MSLRMEMALKEGADSLPMPAWIAIMVLGFIAFWPIGLAILAYLIWSGKMGCWKYRKRGSGSYRNISLGSSGNAAFDEYREETLKRLEEEQREFGMFVERLRRAKDQQEFDQFMAERSRPQPTEGQAN